MRNKAENRKSEVLPNIAVAVELVWMGSVGEAKKATRQKDEVGFGYGIFWISALVGCALQVLTAASNGRDPK